MYKTKIHSFSCFAVTLKFNRRWKGSSNIVFWDGPAFHITLGENLDQTIKGTMLKMNAFSRCSQYRRQLYQKIVAYHNFCKPALCLMVETAHSSFAHSLRGHRELKFSNLDLLGHDILIQLVLSSNNFLCEFTQAV